tara:strand:- start:6243 stop:7652 length:1410 start_codon:yes stop_codon:yes gene_type:complete
MAHPFYGDYKQPNYNVNKDLNSYIRQAAQISSNERIVRKQQEAAKDRLETQIESNEKMFNRTEDRLDTQLADYMQTSAVNRQVSLDANTRANELHPYTKESQKLKNELAKRTMDWNVMRSEYEAKGLKRVEEDNIADDNLNQFIGSELANFAPAYEQGLGEYITNADGTESFVLNKDLGKNLTPYNDIQIEDKYNKFISNYDGVDKNISLEEFRQAWTQLEGNSQFDFNTKLGFDLADWGNRVHGIQNDTQKVLELFRKEYGDQPGFDELWVNQTINNPNAVPATGDFDSDVSYGDWSISKEGMKAQDYLDQASDNFSAWGVNRDLQWDLEDTFNVFDKTDKNKVSKAIKDFAYDLKTTSEDDLDNVKVNAFVDDNGNELFEFWEDDFTLGPWSDQERGTRGIRKRFSGNDRWIGRLGDDGRIYWQESNKDYWRDDVTVYDGKNMLKQTEGFRGGDATDMPDGWAQRGD